MTRSLPVIPWNWIMVLAIEIFFYNTDQLRSEREKARVGLRNLMQQYMLHGKEIRIIRTPDTFTVVLPYV